MAKTKKRSSSAASRREQVQQQRREIAQTTARRQNRRKVARKRSPWLLAGGVIVLLVAIIAIFVYLAHQGSTDNQANTPTDSTTFKAVTNVDPALLSQIGTGGIANPFTAPSGNPAALTGATGKPEFFYYGGEYCPYCAAQRWAVVITMSRFGTFHTLNETTSSSTDVYPNTPTFTFYQSSYTSSYVDFTPVEGTDRNQQPLQSLTSAQQSLVSTYDTSGGIPFIDIGNKYIVLQPVFSPGLLRTNTQDPNSQPLTQSYVASQLSTSNSLSKQILGGANYMTAAICTLTNNQPSSVCSDTSIQSIEKTISKTAKIAPTNSPDRVLAVAGVIEADVRHYS